MRGLGRLSTVFVLFVLVGGVAHAQKAQPLPGAQKVARKRIPPWVFCNKRAFTNTYNGAGCPAFNPQILATIGRPAYGTSFRFSLDASVEPTPGIYSIQLYDQKLIPGSCGPAGEVLVTGNLFKSFNGTHSQNIVLTPNLPVPYDPSLCGSTYYVQAMLFGPAGPPATTLSNAIEVRFGRP